MGEMHACMVCTDMYAMCAGNVAMLSMLCALYMCVNVVARMRVMIFVCRYVCMLSMCVSMLCMYVK